MGRIVVLGAGVFGATAALELQRRGHAVTLVDPGPLPRPEAASTDVSKIVRLDYGRDEASTRLMEQALPRWRAWNREADRTLYHEDGLLVLSEGPMVPGSFEGDSLELLRRRGHALEALDRAALQARCPAWAEGPFDHAYVNPQGGWAESGAVMSWLIGRLREGGVAVREGRPGAVDDEAREADAVLVAAGAWTPLLLPELGGLIQVVGQPVLLFRPKDPERWRPPRFLPFTADVGRTGFYGFPVLPDGTLKLAHHGAGRRVHPDAPRAIAPDDEGRFRAFLRRALPALAEAPLAGSRLCLYDDTPDGHFLIDRHPGRPGVFVAAGGSGHAFKFAPVLGELIADVVEGRPPEGAARYAWGPRRVEGAAAGPGAFRADQARAGRGA